MVKYKLYRLYVRRFIGITNSNGCCADGFEKEFRATKITFKSRNVEEASKKAKKFWEKGQFGTGIIQVLEDN